MKRMKLVFQSLSLSLFLLAGCSTPQTPTPLELRSIQSKDFAAKREDVFKAVVSVFQDMGYIISNADLETGFITAESPAQDNILSEILLSTSMVSQTKATGVIQSRGSGTVVRINFVSTTSSSSAWGRDSRKDTPILDAQVYGKAFEMIEQQLWMMTQ